MDIIALHNEKARKVEELDETKRMINGELDAMSDEIIEFVKKQPLEKQVEILEEMVGSGVTYKLYHELEKLCRKKDEVASHVGK